MSAYAAGTGVPVSRSQDEVRRILKRYGVDGLLIGEEGNRHAVAFAVHDRRVRLEIHMPGLGEFSHTPTGKRRTASAQREQHASETRRRWRALVLIIKAKLEAIESGVTTFDDEFGMHMVLPDGSTVREHVLPALDQAYTSGTVPQLLPGGDS